MRRFVCVPFPLGNTQRVEGSGRFPNSHFDLSFYGCFFGGRERHAQRWSSEILVFIAPNTARLTVRRFDDIAGRKKGFCQSQQKMAKKGG